MRSARNPTVKPDHAAPSLAAAKPWAPPRIRKLLTSEADIAPTFNADTEGHAS